MRRPLVAGNWKLHGSKSEILQLLYKLIASSKEAVNVEIVVCPPFVYLEQVQRLLDGTRIFVGAQTVDVHEQGAFTGEISATMLKEMSCKYVIVGHSERRSCHFESDATVAEQFAGAQKKGIIPILCVGESLEERENGRAFEKITQQIQAVFDKLGSFAFNKAVVAYEPIWAIGTGKAATPALAQEMHAHIRSVIAEKDPESADLLRILYGGSVKSNNAAALFEQPDIDGALVGGASLDAEQFHQIFHQAILVTHDCCPVFLDNSE
jgi:triosephosphate isomerase|tara:strand:+ start:786 stop:1583 length:798 start_codon:yes stop_codon:yes gene_type:complete